MLGKKKKDAVENNPSDMNASADMPAGTVEDIEDGFSDFFDDESTHQPVEDSTQPQVQAQTQDYEQPQEYTQQSEQVYQSYQEPAYQEPHNIAPSSANTSTNKSEEMVLYIIADKKENGLTNYFRECGLKVSSVFDDITEAKNAVLMQSMPTRIVIVDSGKGKFTLTKAREDIIDMLGISDEQNKTTVFFTDSALKADAMRSLGKAAKEIDWIPYKSTNIVAATILAYRENYVYDMEDEADAVESEVDILSMTGFKYIGEPSPRMEPIGLTPASILKNVINGQGEQLRAFEIHL